MATISKQTSDAFGDRSDRVVESVFGASTAQQGNFLDAGGAPLATKAVAVPAGTVVLTRVQRDANARALLKQKTLANASRSAPYLRDRQKQENERAAWHAWAMANDPVYAAREKYIASAGLDTGQITMGAKVLAIGASIIASGGVAAGAVGLTAGGAALASAAAADRLVAAVEKGGELGKQAKAIVDDVKGAAAKGDAVAKQAVATLERVAKERVAAAVPTGAVRALNDAGKQAVGLLTAATGGVESRVASNLTSAASSGPSSGYYAAPLAKPAKVRSSRVAGSNALSTIELPTVRPRWLVTLAGQVADLDARPDLAGKSGFVVWSTGKVVKV